MPREFTKRTLDLVRRNEVKVEALLDLLSMAAIALVVSTEFVQGDFLIPYLHSSFASVQVWIRSAIWVAFIVSFAVYGIASRRPLHYLQTHFLELLICVTWVPHYADGPYAILNDIFVVSRFVPLEVLQLIGTLAHAWRVVRHTGQRFQEHPVIVVGFAVLVLICSGSALLTHIEPGTFKDFWSDGAWFSLTTITTIGFGDLSPKTPLGKLVTSGMIVIGVSLLGVFWALMVEQVRRWLLKQDPNHDIVMLQEQVMQLTSDLAEAKETVGRLEAQSKESHDMLKLLVERSQDKKATDGLASE